MYRRCFICCLAFFWICGALPACAESKVVVYPALADGNMAGDYKVTVDGKDVFVYNNPAAAIAAFDFEGVAIGYSCRLQEPCSACLPVVCIKTL
jgi:hypothetical protein